MAILLQWATGFLCVAALSACSGEAPRHLGLADGGLAPCPSTPNCVSSRASDASHRVESFVLTVSPDAAWAVIREEVEALPGMVEMEESPAYLHAAFATDLFGFVDDLELHLRKSAGTMEIRSASRVGYSDLGVNRKRVEALRRALKRRGVIRQ